MAPFLTHLVVGERVWAAENGQASGGPAYGTFLFGCLAPDVDKLCGGLEQGVTHFVAKSGGTAWTWQRSRRFLNHQAEFLPMPFPELGAEAQAFVRGYLCHVATDEITGRWGAELRRRLAAGGGPPLNVDAFLTVMDPRCWAQATAPTGIVAALAAASIPADTFSFLRLDSLRAMHQIVLPQVRQGGGPEAYLDMVRRQWQWLRHGRVSDARDDADLEADLAAQRQRVEAGLRESQRLVEQMDLALFLAEAVRHSCQRLEALDRA